jgi:hypothetical protein
MNDKIKEIHKQVWLESDHETFDMMFAERIIQECLNVINSNNPRPPGTIIMYGLLQDEYFDEGWQVAVETKAYQIKKLFGITEEQS